MLNISRMVILLSIFLLPDYALAAPVVIVYGTGTYSDAYLDINIYADIQGSSLLNFSVKLTYNPIDLTVIEAVKNENTWYLGDTAYKYPYMNPDTTNQGEIVSVGGVLDINNPTVGVTGNAVLFAHVLFSRNNTIVPDLSISYGRNGNYKNFVTTERLSLDDKADGVIFGQVTISSDIDQDADGDGVGDSVDNCPNKANANQIDSDADGVGDICELKGLFWLMLLLDG